MTAGVHYARVLRGEVDARLLFNRQRVDIGAYHHQRSRRLADLGHQAGFQRQIEDADARRGQGRADFFSGFELLIRQFGKTVHVVAKRLDLAGKRPILLADLFHIISFQCDGLRQSMRRRA